MAGSCTEYASARYASAGSRWSTCLLTSSNASAAVALTRLLLTFESALPVLLSWLSSSSGALAWASTCGRKRARAASRRTRSPLEAAAHAEACARPLTRTRVSLALWWSSRGAASHAAHAAYKAGNPYASTFCKGHSVDRALGHDQTNAILEPHKYESIQLLQHK